MISVQGGFCKRRLFLIFLILLTLTCTAEACKDDSSEYDTDIGTIIIGEIDTEQDAQEYSDCESPVD